MFSFWGIDRRLSPFQTWRSASPSSHVSFSSVLCGEQSGQSKEISAVQLPPGLPSHKLQCFALLLVQRIFNCELSDLELLKCSSVGLNEGIPCTRVQIFGTV